MRKVNEEGQRSFNQQFLCLAKTDLSKFLYDAKVRYRVSYEITNDMGSLVESGYIYRGGKFKNSDTHVTVQQYVETAFGEDFINLLDTTYNGTDGRELDRCEFDTPNPSSRCRFIVFENVPSPIDDEFDLCTYFIDIYNIIYKGQNLLDDEVDTIIKEICKRLNISAM